MQAATAGVAAALAFVYGKAAAQVVGNVGAVTPASLGRPPGEKARNLVLGARIIANELIHTSDAGTTNITFLDRTTLSVGRNSTLIIDKYVYDPESGRGVMTATMAQGVMRFIGGQISHTSGVRVLTPVATIGVRGGMMTVQVGPGGVTVMSHYGHIDVANAANHQLLLRSGFTVHVTGSHDWIADPTQTSLQALNQNYRFLSGGGHHHHYDKELNDFAAGHYGLANTPLANDPDSMPGLDTIGTVNLGQSFVTNRAQQQQWNAAQANLSSHTPPPSPPPPSPPPPPPATGGNGNGNGSGNGSGSGGDNGDGGCRGDRCR